MEQLEVQDIGIQLVNISIQDAEPPTAAVIEAFKAVETAKQGKETAINNANKYRSEQLPEAEAEVDRILNGLGLTPAITGSGLAYRQSISPGELVAIGTVVNVSFTSGNEIERMNEEEKMQQEILEKEAEAAKRKK